jgi:GT2 family glycosyltransferase
MITSKIPQPKVTIIIVHLKGAANLLDCIDSLNQINYENFDILVIHNSSSNSSLFDHPIFVDRHIPKIIRPGNNLGFARANNIGIIEAINSNSNYVLLLNDDTVVSPEFLNELINVAEINQDVGMLGPKICYFDQPQKIWFNGATFKKETCQVFSPGSRQPDSHSDNPMLLDSDYISGCSLLVKTNLLDRIGLLDERFFLYWEDVDWGLRVIKAKGRNVIVPSAKIWHKISASTGGPDSPLKAYHKTRSHLLFSKLHTPGTNARLIVKYGRDVLWLLAKSTDPHRFVKARAYLTAIIDYYSGKTDKGPRWLWTKAVY